MVKNTQYKKRMKTVKVLYFSKLEQVLKKNLWHCSKAIYDKIQYIRMQNNTSFCNAVSQKSVILCEVLKCRLMELIDQGEIEPLPNFHC